MTVKPFKQRGRVLRYVAILLSNVACFALGVAVGHDKLKTQRERPSEDRINRVPVEGHMWPIFTVSDHIEKLLDEEARVCTNVVTVGSLKGGIWTEADNVVLKLLDDEARVYTNMVPVDVKPASAGEGER